MDLIIGRAPQDAPLLQRWFGPFLDPGEVLAAGEAFSLPGHDDEAASGLQAVAHYAADFLASPHPALGRSGPVCPFVGEAFRRGSFLLSLSSPDCIDIRTVRLAVAEMLEAFSIRAMSLGAPASQFLGMIVAFPYLPAAIGGEIIETVQKTAKPDFLDRGMMVGQFHPDCQAGGLHNPDFRPMQTPLPCLAIRHMTVFDAPFMIEQDGYVASYVRQFGVEGRRRIARLAGRDALA